jgi:hypothetical protein
MHEYYPTSLLEKALFELRFEISNIDGHGFDDISVAIFVYPVQEVECTLEVDERLLRVAQTFFETSNVVIQ